MAGEQTAIEEPQVLTVVTAADGKYSRCLFQFLLSAERHRLHGRHRFVAYDLGLGETRLAALRRRFPWCAFRRFDFAPHPPHIGRDLRNNGWKPLVVADALERDGGLLLWLDSATILKSSLDPVAATIRNTGIYSLAGQSPLGRRCDRAVLDQLGVPLELRNLRERVGGVLGLDTRHPAARRLVESWRDLALVEAWLGTRRPDNSHMADQALLGIVLHRMAAAGEIALGDDEIDISSASPVRWMSSRNKVPEWLPAWLDAPVRAYYATWKAIDRGGIRLERRLVPAIDGLMRWRKEHFSVFVAAADAGSVVEVRAPRLRYYADPFVWTHEGRTALFVEEFDFLRHRARLCCMSLGPGLEVGEAQPIALGGRHVSFPYLFTHEGELYMLPETCIDECVDLYRCEAFPHRWRLVRRLLHGIDAADSVLLPHEGRWWLLTSLREDPSGGARSLAIFHSEDLFAGAWHAHPVNARRLYAGSPFGLGRNAGPPVRVDGAWLRPMQHNVRYYGEGLRWMRIDVLTPDDFRESPYTGTHGLARFAERVSPHHLCRHGDIVAWDVRDRASTWQLLGRRRGAKAAAPLDWPACGLPEAAALELRSVVAQTAPETSV